MKFFLPQQPIFFDHFRQLNGCIKETTSLLSEFAATFRDFELFFSRAKEIEHRADDTTHTIIQSLNKTFITPFDREDIYALAQRMDDVIDTIERVIQNFFIYQITAKREGVDEFVVLAMKASNALDQLIAECFTKQRMTAETRHCIIRLHDLEDDGDVLFQKYIRRLFTDESDPLLVVKWKDIYYNLEDIMDTFQQVSDTLESIMVKTS